MFNISSHLIYFIHGSLYFLFTYLYLSLLSLFTLLSILVSTSSFSISVWAYSFVVRSMSLKLWEVFKNSFTCTYFSLNKSCTLLTLLCAMVSRERNYFAIFILPLFMLIADTCSPTDSIFFCWSWYYNLCFYGVWAATTNRPVLLHEITPIYYSWLALSGTRNILSKTTFGSITLS